eukprot:gene12140-biopygen8896
MQENSELKMRLIDQQQAATAKLRELCFDGDSRSWRESPDVAALRACVERGANVMEECVTARGVGGLGTTNPALSVYMSLLNVDVVKCLLASPLPINFTHTNESGMTPLHVVVRDHDQRRVGEMLTAVLDRLAKRPDVDTVDWGLTDKKGHEPASVAGYWKQLGTLMRCVRRAREKTSTEYFLERKARISLTLPTSQEDWFQLTDADRDRFDNRKGFDD